VVLDSNLRMPHHARLCRHPDKQCWILTTSNLSHPPYKGAEIITLEEQGTRPGRKQDAHSAFRDQRGHQDARIPQ
jgi:riboflavin biosynthesis pyrimidine reductase